MSTNETKNDSLAPAAAALSPAEKSAAIQEALAALAETHDRNKQKGLRAKLRRLGHVGGLRATKDADAPVEPTKSEATNKGKRAKVSKKAAEADDVPPMPHPLSNTKAAKAARKANEKKGK